jgi:lysophospholipase L1-like esterase
LPKIYNLVCDGNSVTAGTGASNADNTSWPPVCMNALITSQASHPNAFWSLKSVAVSGQTTPQRTAAFATSVQPLFNQDYAHNIVSFFEVRNDVNFNAVTLEQAITNVQAYVTQARANGWEVLLITPTPTSQTTNGQNTIINNFNAWLRLHPEWSDIPIVDTAAHASLSNPANLTFFNADGLHLTDAGYAVIADLVEDRLATIGPASTVDAQLLLKRLVYDFDLLEVSNNALWVTRVAAIATASNRRLFQGGNMDRLRARYSAYGLDSATQAALYAELVTAFNT